MSMKIAVIDDSYSTLKWVKDNLAGFGFEVVIHNSPLGTQAFIRDHMPDLVLLDVMMPGLSGDVLCKMIRKNPNLKHIKIVFFSTIEPEKLRTLAEKSQVNGFISKTYDPAALARQVQKFIES